MDKIPNYQEGFRKALLRFSPQERFEIEVDLMKELGLGSHHTLNAYKYGKFEFRASKAAAIEKFFKERYNMQPEEIWGKAHLAHDTVTA